MCKASIEARAMGKVGTSLIVQAKTGDQVSIDKNIYGMGVATSKQGATSCIHCLHTGAELIVENVPDIVQRKLGLSSTERLVFIETPGSHSAVIHDLVVVSGRSDLPQMPLAVFVGSRAKVVRTTSYGQITPEKAIGQVAETHFASAKQSTGDIVAQIALRAGAKLASAKEPVSL